MALDFHSCSPEAAQGPLPGVLLCSSEGGAGTSHLFLAAPLTLEAGLYGPLLDCGGKGQGSLKTEINPKHEDV